MTERGVGIVGLGLIGGSLARALVAAGVRVVGFTLDAADARAAAAEGVAVVSGVEQVAAAAVDLVVLAVPLPALHGVAAALLAQAPAEWTVLHLAGLQRPEATRLDAAATRRIIGTHPIAGSHGAGFAASRGDLFAGATVWAEARADAPARARLEWLWSLAGAGTVRYSSAAAHDAAMAWVSHLPQLAATAMAGALAAAGVPAAMGGPGLRDATRLAASPFPLWRDVLAAAPPDTDAALAGLQAALGEVRAALRCGDAATLETLWARAGEWRGDSRPSHPCDGAAVPYASPRAHEGAAGW